VKNFHVYTKDNHVICVHGDRIEFGKSFICIVEDINIVFLIEKENVSKILPDFRNATPVGDVNKLW
jgi:hypothetical protein